MIGEGISAIDLFQLLNSIRAKSTLRLDVKILDGDWEPVSAPAIKSMISAINAGKITSGNEIRLRLHEKDKDTK